LVACAELTHPTRCCLHRSHFYVSCAAVAAGQIWTANSRSLPHSGQPVARARPRSMAGFKVLLTFPAHHQVRAVRTTAVLTCELELSTHSGH